MFFEKNKLNNLIETNDEIFLDKIIIKTGSVKFAELSQTVGTSKQRITFEKPFPHKCLLASSSVSGTTTPSTLACLIHNPNDKTGLTIFAENKRIDQNCYVYWFAIGY